MRGASAKRCAAIPDGADKRENAGNAGEQADVAKTISRVRGGAVCHPDTIIRLRTCPANGFERISGWPAFLLNSLPLAGAWRQRERRSAEDTEVRSTPTVWHSLATDRWRASSNRVYQRPESVTASSRSWSKLPSCELPSRPQQNPHRADRADNGVHLNAYDETHDWHLQQSCLYRGQWNV